MKNKTKFIQTAAIIVGLSALIPEIAMARTCICQQWSKSNGNAPSCGNGSADLYCLGTTECSVSTDDATGKSHDPCEAVCMRNGYKLGGKCSNLTSFVKCLGSV